MFEQGSEINFFTNPPSTAPSPAPGIVTEVTGDDDYSVQITLANDVTRIEEHVGDREANPDRYIKAREGGTGYEPPVIEEAGEL